MREPRAVFLPAAGGLRVLIYPAIARPRLGDDGSGKGVPALTTVGKRYGLTQRKLDVLLEVALGLSDQEIASKLFLSKSTVKTHLRTIFHTLKIRNRTEAAAFVMAHGLLPGVTSAPGRSSRDG